MERSESTLHTRRRISWNESEVARASCTGVHVPTGAYLSLWCARDILISSQSFSLSLSLSLFLLCIRSSTSIPFDCSFSYLSSVSPLSLFIYVSPTFLPPLFTFIDDYLVAFFSFCVYTLLLLPFVLWLHALASSFSKCRAGWILRFSSPGGARSGKIERGFTGF